MIVGHAKAVHGRVQYSKIRATILQYNFKKQTMPNMVEKRSAHQTDSKENQQNIETFKGKQETIG